MIFQSLYLVLGLVKVKVYHGGMSAVLVCCRGHNPTGPHHGEGGHLCHPSCGGGGHRRCSCGGGCSRSGGHGGCFWWLVLSWWWGHCCRSGGGHGGGRPCGAGCFRKVVLW